MAATPSPAPPIPQRLTSLPFDTNSSFSPWKSTKSLNTTPASSEPRRQPVVPQSRKLSTSAAAPLPPATTFSSLASTFEAKSLPRKRKAVTFNDENSYYESPWEYETVVLLNNCDNPDIEGSMDELSLYPRVRGAADANGEKTAFDEKELQTAVEGSVRNKLPWKRSLYRSPTLGIRPQVQDSPLIDKGDDRREGRGKRKVRVIRLLNKGVNILKHAVS